MNTEFDDDDNPQNLHDCRNGPRTQREWLQNILLQRCGHTRIRDFQLDHGLDLINGRDVFLVTAPGSGKTLVSIAPLLWAQSMKQSGIAIVVEPSKFLTEQQSIVFAKYGIDAVAINEDTLREEFTRTKTSLFGRFKTAASPGSDILAVFMTPWMLNSDGFFKLLQNQDIKAAIRWCVIDEAHLVNEQGTVWREPYNAIKLLRPRLLSSTIYLAITGTCSPSEDPIVTKNLGFLPGSYVHARYSLDRSNLKFIPRFLQHATSTDTFLDLAFLIPLETASATDIPTTLIFCKTIGLGYSVMTFLDTLIPASIANHDRIILPCNSLWNAEHRNRFRRALESGVTRIGVCTDTCTLGVDIFNVSRVVVLDELSFNQLKQKLYRGGVTNRVVRRKLNQNKGLIGTLQPLITPGGARTNVLRL
ncbi:P-loop containing nucleoside triphosphate hydrolase protein [Cristinia sonorae]|uniref:P-loop containing nucleoside triphosphate hydrolase protein n=1 Tax=Cristinia sonorae TaxID=1940300 RepID=A0A8K0XLD5_9AGAR|nr:P-loop containing nucleoside triphosphate hydrolase protein [Cristinia sonorae]